MAFKRYEYNTDTQLFPKQAVICSHY